MVRLTFLLIALIALSGCSIFKKRECPTSVPPVEIREVKVPVATCPANISKLQVGDRPDLLTQLLSEQDKKKPDVVGKYYVIDLEKLSDYAKRLETANGELIKQCQEINK